MTDKEYDELVRIVREDLPHCYMPTFLKAVVREAHKMQIFKEGCISEFVRYEEESIKDEKDKNIQP